MKIIACMLFMLILFGNQQNLFASNDYFVCKGDCDVISFYPNGFNAYLPPYRITNVSVWVREPYDLSNGNEVIIEFDAQTGGFGAGINLLFFNDEQTFSGIISGSTYPAAHTRIHLTQKQKGLPKRGYIGFSGLSSGGLSTRPSTVSYYNFTVTTVKNENYEEGLEAGKTQCKHDPASCGIIISSQAESCMPNKASFSLNSGLLNIPVLEVEDLFGNITDYQAKLSLLPGKEQLFSVTQAAPRSDEQD